MIERDFQSRLAAKQELIKRKILDNGTSLAGNPTDCIRLRVTKNDEGDYMSTQVIKATVEPMIWPALKDIPIRKLSDNGNGSYKITSLSSIAEDGQNQNFDIIYPHGSDLCDGDLIVRVFLDPDVGVPVVVAVQVTQVLGTFGQMMVLNQKCHCSLYTETIPEKLLNVIGEMAKRRLAIKF